MGLDLPRVIVECDSLEVVNLFADNEVSSHQYSQINMGIIQLQTDHGNLVIRHVPREANSLADYIAKVGLSLPYGQHIFKSPFGECHTRLLQNLVPIASPDRGSAFS